MQVISDNKQLLLFLRTIALKDSIINFYNKAVLLGYNSVNVLSVSAVCKNAARQRADQPLRQRAVRL